MLLCITPMSIYFYRINDPKSSIIFSKTLGLKDSHENCLSVAGDQNTSLEGPAKYVHWKDFTPGIVKMKWTKSMNE